MKKSWLLIAMVALPLTFVFNARADTPTDWSQKYDWKSTSVHTVKSNNLAMSSGGAEGQIASGSVDISIKGKEARSVEVQVREEAGRADSTLIVTCTDAASGVVYESRETASAEAASSSNHLIFTMPGGSSQRLTYAANADGSYTYGGKSYPDLYSCIEALGPAIPERVPAELFFAAAAALDSTELQLKARYRKGKHNIVVGRRHSY